MWRTGPHGGGERLRVLSFLNFRRNVSRSPSKDKVRVGVLGTHDMRSPGTVNRYPDISSDRA